MFVIELHDPAMRGFLRKLLEQLHFISFREVQEAEAGNYNREALLARFRDLQQKRPFKGIEDPVEWQKNLRDEWE